MATTTSAGRCGNFGTNIATSGVRVFLLVGGECACSLNLGEVWEASPPKVRWDRIPGVPRESGAGPQERSG